MNPIAEEGGELRGGLRQWVQQYTGAQINFGDLTPYLTYDWSTICMLYEDSLDTVEGMKGDDLPDTTLALLPAGAVVEKVALHREVGEI